MHLVLDVFSLMGCIMYCIVQYSINLGFASNIFVIILKFILYFHYLARQSVFASSFVINEFIINFQNLPKLLRV